MKNAAAAACLFAGLTAFSIGARADEEKIALKDVPKAVLDAVKARFPKAEIKAAEKEVEDGKTSFEIALEDDEHNIDVALNADGKILEIEKEVAAKDLPKTVLDAVAAKHPNGKIKKAEEILAFENGKEEKSFEVIVETAGGKSVEAKLTPDGKVVKQDDDDDKAEKNEKDDD